MVMKTTSVDTMTQDQLPDVGLAKVITLRDLKRVISWGWMKYSPVVSFFFDTLAELFAKLKTKSFALRKVASKKSPLEKSTVLLNIYIKILRFF